MSEDPVLRAEVVSCGNTISPVEVSALSSTTPGLSWAGLQANWRFDQDFGGVWPYNDPAAVACAIDKVLKGHYTESLAIWWSSGNVFNAGPPGTCPVDPAPGPRRDGPLRAGQEAVHTPQGVFAADLQYKIYTCSLVVNVNEYIATPDIGGVDQGAWWTNVWDPQGTAPYNDAPYLSGFTASGDPTLLSATLTIPAWGQVGSPAALSMYAGVLGDTGGGFPDGLGPQLWTGDPTGGISVSLSAAQIAAGLVLAGGAATFAVTFIDSNTASGSFLTPPGDGTLLDYWYPATSPASTLTLEFTSPEFCVAQMPAAPPAAPRPSCRPVFATPVVESEDT